MPTGSEGRESDAARQRQGRQEKRNRKGRVKVVHEDEEWKND